MSTGQRAVTRSGWSTPTAQSATQRVNPPQREKYRLNFLIQLGSEVNTNHMSHCVHDMWRLRSQKVLILAVGGI